MAKSRGILVLSQTRFQNYAPDPDVLISWCESPSIPMRTRFSGLKLPRPSRKFGVIKPCRFRITRNLRCSTLGSAAIINIARSRTSSGRGCALLTRGCRNGPTMTVVATTSPVCRSTSHESCRSSFHVYWPRFRQKPDYKVSGQRSTKKAYNPPPA